MHDYQSWFNKLRDQLSKKKPMVGLDAGTRTLKLVKLSSFKVPFEFEQCMTFVRREDFSPSVVKSRTSRFEQGAHSVALSVADEKIQNYEFKTPKMPKSELDTAIRWELKKHVTGLDNIYHDVIINETSEGHDVECVVAPKKVVKEYYKTAQDYGLEPCSLETESSSLCACADAMKEGDELDKVALIDLGLTSFRLIFIHNGKVSFTRSLPFGFASFYQRISSQWNFSHDEIVKLAHELKSEESDTAKAPLVALERMLHESLNMLLEEFRASEIHIKDKKDLPEIDEIFLCGGGACVEAVVEYLQHSFSEKKMGVLDPFKKARSIPKGIDPKSGPIWACAVGLALREQI